MNLKNAKTLSLKESRNVLPKWWLEMFDTVLSIISHSSYSSFKQAETFFCAGLSFIPDKESSEIKFIKVKCENKGEKNSHIYVTIVIWFMFKDKNKRLWKLSKSVRILKREKTVAYD